MNDEPFSVNITVAAQRIGRCVETMRRYSELGTVAGVKIDVHRHPTTNIRHFRRSQIEALYRALHGCKRMSIA